MTLGYGIDITEREELVDLLNKGTHCDVLMRVVYNLLRHPEAKPPFDEAHAAFESVMGREWDDDKDHEPKRKGKTMPTKIEWVKNAQIERTGRDVESNPRSQQGDRRGRTLLRPRIAWVRALLRGGLSRSGSAIPSDTLRRMRIRSNCSSTRRC